MFESGKNPAIKKSYEIAYALFRISATTGEKSFSEAITAEGIRLLKSSADGKYEELEKIILAVEYFMKLGGDVGVINPANSEAIVSEINVLRQIIAELSKVRQVEPVDLSDIFNGSTGLNTDNIKKDSDIISNSAKQFGNSVSSFNNNEEYDPSEDIFEPAKGNNKFGKGIFSNVNLDNEISDNIDNFDLKDSDIIVEKEKTDIKSAIKFGSRQLTILERIRQSGNCRIKDLLQLFPDYSERTLRYDLQFLIEQHLIEKIGVAGPAVYYKSKVADRV